MAVLRQTSTPNIATTASSSLYITISSDISTAIMAADMQWGVTPPLSVALPNEMEKRANEALFAELKAQNTFEHATETAKRHVRPTTRPFSS